MAALRLLKPYYCQPFIVILGCTGTGKSKLAIELAKTFNGEVINADAMQLYKGLDIITNKVTPEEQDGIQHHLLGFLNPLKNLTVCEYKELALYKMKEIFDRKNLPILVGGTFYYVESILYDFVIGEPKGIMGTESWFDGESNLSEDKKEEKPPRKKFKLREYKDLAAELEKLDNEILYKRLKEVDPEMAKKTHPNSKRKIVRAIMVYEESGETLSSILSKQRSQPGGCESGGPLRFTNCIILWLQCDSEVLNERLYTRVDDMLSRGLVDELLEFYKLCEKECLMSFKNDARGIYQSIGLKEFHEFLMLDEEEQKSEEGKKLLEKGVELLKIANRQYAKKQLKWVKNRFLRNGFRQVPPIYSLNATDTSMWKENVYDIAENIVRSHLSGEKPSVEPLPIEKTKNVIDQIYECDCGSILVGKVQYELHLNGRNHVKLMKRKNRKEEQEEKMIKQEVTE